MNHNQHKSNTINKIDLFNNSTSAHFTYFTVTHLDPDISHIFIHITYSLSLCTLHIHGAHFIFTLNIQPKHNE